MPRKQPHLTQVPPIFGAATSPFPCQSDAKIIRELLPYPIYPAYPSQGMPSWTPLCCYTFLHGIGITWYQQLASLECKFTEHRDFALFTILFSELKFTVSIQIIFTEWMNMNIVTLGFKIQSAYIYSNRFNQNVIDMWAQAHGKFIIPSAPSMVSSTV